MDEYRYEESIYYNIAVQIGNLTDEAFIDAIRRWAESENVTDVYLMDSRQLKEVFELGAREYKRMYGSLQPFICNKMEFRDGKQVGNEWRTTK